ncbi:MAG: hypothetical protein NC340_07440 [Ruminococcus flavefaciens]|nr:hypothetical protein [Ruminococcus flavefaciens]
MTAVTSSKKNFFCTRYLNNLRSSNKLLIINSVLEILGLPVIAIILIIGFYFEGKELTDAERITQDIVMAGCIPFAMIACCTIAASVLIGSLIALSQYSYLYKKTITDMNYSLPLSGTQRFFADYLSGFTIYIGIPLVSVALSLLILGVGSIFVDMSELWKVMPFILSLVFIVIAAMIEYYTISIFALTFCGNTFESHFSVLAFVIMIPATIGCLWFAVTESSTFGMVGDAIFQKSIFTTTSPVGAFAFFVMYIDLYGEVGTSSMYAKWMIITLLVTALYLGGAYLLQRFRKAEDVSKPYVYRSFFYILMTMGTFCVLSMFIMSDAFIVAGIVLCAIIWFIMEIITRRGFKKFWTAPISFTVAVVSVFGVCWLCDVTDGFGASKRVPSAINVSSVSINLGNLAGNYMEDIDFKDKDVIKEAIALNKEIVDRHYNPEDYSYNTVPESYEDYGKTDDYLIEFEYTKLSGSTVSRRYRINSGMADGLVKAIVMSDEYAYYQATSIGRYEVYEVGSNKNNYRISVMDKLMLKEADDKKVSEKQLDEIRNAYIKDMQAMTEEELLNGDVYCFIDQVWVLESFENTISLLDTNVPEISTSTFSDRGLFVEFDVNPEILTYVQTYINGENGTSNYYYYNNDDEYPAAFADKITRIYPAMTYIDNSATVGIGKKNVIEILNNCTPIIIGEMPLAVVNVDGRNFYLRNTPENAELLSEAGISKSSHTGSGESVPDTYGWDTELLSIYH